MSPRGLTVMSFNIRYATAPDGENSWENRRRLVIERIRRLAPDLLGVQECRSDGQLQDLLAGLPGYGWIGAARGGASDAAAEMAPVLYRRARFDLLDSEIYWLSETPEIPGSLGWGAALPRTCTWALLNESSQQIWFANTHFDHWSWEARLKSADLLCQSVRTRPQTEIRILTGDFNASKDTDPYRILAGCLADPFRSPHLAGRSEAGSFHDFGRLDPPEPIDWILASPGLVPQGAWVEDGRVGERWLSDHHPVVARFH